MGRRHQKLRQKKSLGQVFLNTKWPVLKVADKVTSLKVTRVLEIGPGPGILTKELLQRGLKVTAVEKDDRFADRLKESERFFPENTPGNLEIVNQDVLKFDLEEWLAQSKEPTAIVGNIPYNISTPILQWALPFLNEVKCVSFLVQLEFAMRLAGKVGTKAYGSLSVFTQLRSKVEIDCKVDRACFSPVPKVDSAIVTLTRSASPLDKKLLQKVELLTRASFTQRRKILKNAIRPFLADKDEAACPIDLSRRPDSLRPDEFIELAKFLID